METIESLKEENGKLKENLNTSEASYTELIEVINNIESIMIGVEVFNFIFLRFFIK